MPSRGPNNATRSLRPESVTRKIRSLAGRGGVGIDFLLHFPKLQAAKGMGSGTALSFTCRNRMGCERRYYCESHRVASEVAFLRKAKYRSSSGLLRDVNQAVLPAGAGAETIPPDEKRVLFGICKSNKTSVSTPGRSEYFVATTSSQKLGEQE